MTNGRWSTGLAAVVAVTIVAAAGCDDDAGDGGSGGAGGAGTTSATTTGGDATTGGEATTGGDPSAGGGGATSSSQGGGPAGCERGVIEDELVAQGDGAWQGPGADPETGALLAADGRFVVSSTYLALQDDALPRFGELMAPILGELEASPDLVAVRLGVSSSCGTARTLSVWRSVEGMMTFVASDAHAAAVDAVGEVSRGGSVVTHWETTELATVDWDEAARRVAADEGPFY